MCRKFRSNILSKLEGGEIFTTRIVSDDGTFQPFVHVKRNNIRTCGNNNPQAVVKDKSQFQYLSNIFRALIFRQRTVTSDVYLKILREALMHIVQEEGRNNMPFHQDRGSSH